MYGASGGRAKAERKSGAKEEAGPGGTGGGGNRVELLVFGYACKLFRDDERALAQEQGQHLIPWMGDQKILIDRYDGRGHLHDLSEYEAAHATWNRDYQLSEEEARVEALCDEERYLALHTDLLEEEARQEEEYKRLSEALAEDGSYNAVGFTYGSDYYDPSEPTEEEEPSKQREKSEAENTENEEPFVAPLGLNVPPDVELPPTAKMHAIIERTARFVCRQGAQFEIMLKARQARNSQFDFLRFDHYLNPYYKFIQKAVKEGRYPVLAEGRGEEKQKPGASSDNEDDEDEGDGNYLHPSLFASRKCDRLEELMKPLKVVDPDHPLAALVRKAQADSPAPTPPSADGAAAPPSQVEYPADSAAAAMYYSYYVLPDGTYCLAPPPPGVDVATYYSTLPATVAVSSTTGVTATAPPPPGTTPPPPQTTSETSSGVTSTTITTSALAPVAAIIPPPPDIQPVIDKLAEYVARNGLKFETSVRAKNDQRFEFLQPWHQYNAYYEFKKQSFLQKEGRDGAQAVSASEEAPAESAPEKLSDLGEDGVAEDPADAGGRGGSGGKKESASNKATADGKLVKGTLGPAFSCPPALAGRGSGLPEWGPPWASATPDGGAVLTQGSGAPCGHPSLGHPLSQCGGHVADAPTKGSQPARLTYMQTVVPGGMFSTRQNSARLTSVTFYGLGRNLSSASTDRHDHSQCNNPWKAKLRGRLEKGPLEPVAVNPGEKGPAAGQDRSPTLGECSGPTAKPPPHPRL